MTSDDVGLVIEQAVNKRMRLQFEAEQYADDAFEGFDWARAISDPAYIESFFAQVGLEILKKYGNRSYELGGEFAERFD